MDADEFLGVFFDKLEKQLSLTSHSRLLSEYYGGRVCHRIASKECTHVTTREENFFVLSLEVKGKKDIIESLNLFVAEDILDGDNKYHCEKCNRKVAASKGCCVSHLPQTLLIHLKRFEFDVETFMRAKVNDNCAFPLTLDMNPYTQSFLFPTQTHTQNDSSTIQNEMSDLSHSPPPTHTSTPPHTSPPTPQNQIYHLVGVIVHTGTAESGHYYSFIKDRYPTLRQSTFTPTRTPTTHTEGGLWLQFNDSSIELFDLNDLSSQCFGGFDPMSQGDPPVTRFYPRSYSAYILVYELSERQLPPLSCGVPKTVEEMVKLLPKKMYEKVWSENTEFLCDKNLFCVHYARFVSEIGNLHFSPLPTGVVVDLHGDYLSAFRMLGTFLLNTYCYSKKKTLLHPIVERMKEIAKASKESREWFFTSLTTSDVWLRRMLIECQCQQSRKEFLSLILSFIELLQHNQTQLQTQTKSLLITTLTFLNDSHTFWRNLDEYFVLFFKLTSLPSVCMWFFKADILVRFAHFYMENASTFHPLPLESEITTNILQSPQTTNGNNKTQLSSLTRKMGEKETPPPFKAMFSLMSLMICKCVPLRVSLYRRLLPSVTPLVSSLRNEEFDVPVMEVDSNEDEEKEEKEGEEEERSLSVRNAEIFCSKAFLTQSISDGIDTLSLTHILTYLSHHNPLYSSFLLSHLPDALLTVDSANYKNASLPFFQILKALFRISDTLTSARISSFHFHFLSYIRKLLSNRSPSTPIALLHYEELIHEVPLCGEWLFENLSLWVSEWLLLSSEVLVRRKAADILLSLFVVNESSDDVLVVDESLSDLPTATPPTQRVVDREKATHILQFLLSLLAVAEECKDARGRRIVRSNEKLYPLDCYLVAEYFRVIRVLCESGADERYCHTHMPTFLRLVIEMDDYRIDCDENKAELLDLVFFLTQNETMCDLLARNSELCERLLGWYIVDASTSHYVAYNSRSLPTLYFLIHRVASHNSSLVELLSKHINVPFAIRQFLCSKNFPTVAHSLSLMTELFSQSSAFRSSIIDVFAEVPLVPFSVSLLPHLLQTKADYEQFLTRHGFTLLTSHLLDFNEIYSDVNAINVSKVFAEILCVIQR
jgi:hypothetical protein